MKLPGVPGSAALQKAKHGHSICYSKKAEICMKKKMDMRIVKYMLLAAALILGILYCEVILSGIGSLWGIVTPLVLGGVFAYVLNIVMRMLEKHYFPGSHKAIVQKSRRPVCMVLSIILIVLVFALILLLVVPELGKAFMIIGQAIPVYYQQVLNWIMANADYFPVIEEELANLKIDWSALGDSVWNYLKAGVGGLLNSTFSIVGSMFGAIVNFIISLIFCLYILSSKEKLGGQFRRLVHAYVPKKWADRGWRVLKTADATFSSFIVGQCTEAVILGSLCTACMLIFRFPYAPMIGAFIGVTALIPVVGAYLGAAVGAFMILTVDPMKALLFLVFILILQQIEGNVIYPKVVGSSIGLPGMWVLAAVTVGSGLMGVVGMLLGVPTAATVYKLLAQDVRKKNESLDEVQELPCSEETAVSKEEAAVSNEEQEAVAGKEELAAFENDAEQKAAAAQDTEA